MREILTISEEQWRAKRACGLGMVIDDRPYIVAADETTHEPVYQPVRVRESIIWT